MYVRVLNKNVIIEHNTVLVRVLQENGTNRISLSLILRRQRVGEVENTQGIGSCDYGGLRHSGVGIKWQSSRTWNSPLPTDIPGEVPRSGSPNWRFWGADGIAPVSKPAGVRPRESQCFSCSLRAGQD